MAQWINEQRIHIVDTNYMLCEKNWTRTRSGTGSYGRWQKKYRYIQKFLKITVHQKIQLFASFKQGTASLQQ